MMVYVPPGIRLAVKGHAAETRVLASDVVVAAVRDYLAARGMAIDDVPPAVADAPAGPPAPVDRPGVGEALDRQARLIEEVLLRLDEAVPRPAPPRATRAPSRPGPWWPGG